MTAVTVAGLVHETGRSTAANRRALSAGGRPGRTSPAQGISSRMAGSAALGRVAVRVASSVSA